MSAQAVLERARIPILALALATARVAAGATGESASDSGEPTHVLLRTGYYAAAESSARILMARAQATPGPDSLDYARAADLLVEPLWRLAKSQRAETRALAQAAIRIKERALGADSPELAISLQNQGEMLRSYEQNKPAQAYFRRAIEIREKALGPDDNLTAASLASLARAIGDTSAAAAKPLFARALAIREEVLPAKHQDLARSIFQMAWVLRQNGEAMASKATFERALAMQEEILRPGHPELAMTIYHYASLLRGLNEMQKAKGMLERALKMREDALGPQHPDVAWSLVELGTVAANTGDYALGRQRLERAVAIFTNPAFPIPIAEARARATFGYLLTQSGDLREARHQFDLSIRGIESIRGRDDSMLEGPLADYGTFNLVIGDFETARTLFERAYTIHVNRSGSDLRSSFFLLKLGSTAWSMQQYAMAESLLLRCIEIKEKVLGPESPDLEAPLEYLGFVYFEQGDYTRARHILERAATIEQKTRVHGAAGGINTDMMLATIDHILGNDADAERRLRALIDKCRNVLGAESPHTGGVLGQLAEFMMDVGRTSAAVDTALLAEQICREDARATVRSLPERQALNYSEFRDTGLPTVLTLSVQGLDGGANARIWDALIRSRALVLDEIAGRHRRVSDIARRARSLAEASDRLARLSVRGPGTDTPEHYRQALDAAREDKERAERELAESGNDRRGNDPGDVGFEQAAAAVHEGSALVAFAAYDHRDPQVHGVKGGSPGPPEVALPSTPSYMAFVLRGGEIKPEAVAIGTRAKIDSLISRWGERVSRGSRVPASWLKESDYRPVGEALRRAIWDPVAAHLAGASRVFVVPDGALSLVNLATLPDAGTGYLLESGPLFMTLGSERDLARPDAPLAGTGLLAVGGADFDAAPSMVAVAEMRATAAQEGSRDASAPTFRGERTRCGHFESMRWSALASTSVEARQVAALWASAAAPDDAAATRPQNATTGEAAHSATLLTGAQASESALKRAAPGKRALHIATHGFFLNGRCSSGTDDAGGARGVRAIPQATENPLLLSGLVLAGANQRAEVAEGQDDGVLTAEEVSALDLNGVDWAVLSACETGVGKVRTGEGVFGLRRAFQIAGARTLIMSLWPVEDEPTRAWMKSLYEAHLLRHLGSAEAVRAASLELLRERRAQGRSAHPFFWGAFVAAGDWR